ncbi:hypothetical protein JKP88DRAFT_334873 [Tribonema minus]|uniref:Uncharacterized protein n=1 Tax=Tribonema minus TaxID=303371 RepID=A0A836C904_9STRA|nr:hypothetical protein JKP88DRAFT_334873 [Tribonema minus]
MPRKVRPVFEQIFEPGISLHTLGLDAFVDRTLLSPPMRPRVKRNKSDSLEAAWELAFHRRINVIIIVDTQCRACTRPADRHLPKGYTTQDFVHFSRRTAAATVTNTAHHERQQQRWGGAVDQPPLSGRPATADSAVRVSAQVMPGTRPSTAPTLGSSVCSSSGGGTGVDSGRGSAAHCGSGNGNGDGGHGCSRNSKCDGAADRRQQIRNWWRLQPPLLLTERNTWARSGGSSSSSAQNETAAVPTSAGPRRALLVTAHRPRSAALPRTRSDGGGLAGQARSDHASSKRRPAADQCKSASAAATAPLRPRSAAARAAAASAAADAVPLAVYMTLADRTRGLLGRQQQQQQRRRRRPQTAPLQRSAARDAPVTLRARPYNVKMLCK